MMTFKISTITNYSNLYLLMNKEKLKIRDCTILFLFTSIITDGQDKLLNVIFQL